MKVLWKFFLNQFKADRTRQLREHVVFTLREQNPERQARLRSELEQLRRTGHDVMIFSRLSRTGLLESLAKHRLQEGQYSVVV